MGLSPLKKHKFDYNFNDTPDAFCPTRDGIENMEHFLLLCRSFNDIRATLMHNVTLIMREFDAYPNKKKLEILLYGSKMILDEDNRKILQESISFITKSKRFENIQT